jgi:hypothetical protein
LETLFTGLTLATLKVLYFKHVLQIKPAVTVLALTKTLIVLPAQTAELQAIQAHHFAKTEMFTRTTKHTPAQTLEQPAQFAQAQQQLN